MCALRPPFCRSGRRLADPAAGCGVTVAADLRAVDGDGAQPIERIVAVGHVAHARDGVVHDVAMLSGLNADGGLALTSLPVDLWMKVPQTGFSYRFVECQFN